MKHKGIIIGIILIASVIGFSIGCTKTEKKEPLKKITIETTTKREDGSLTMYDPDGSEYLRFNGVIHIENDGSNGQPIEIKVYQNESEDYEFN